jgi:hypothetical protein
MHSVLQLLQQASDEVEVELVSDTPKLDALVALVQHAVSTQRRGV